MLIVLAGAVSIADGYPRLPGRWWQVGGGIVLIVMGSSASYGRAGPMRLRPNEALQPTAQARSIVVAPGSASPHNPPYSARSARRS